MTPELLSQLKRHEGFKTKVYRDTEGFLSIGYGYNLDANPLKLSPTLVNNLISKGIAEPTAERYLVQCAEQVIARLPERIPVYRALSQPRRDVLANMAYNMGLRRLLGFKNTLRFLTKGDYDDAALEMLDSAWAKTVKTRAIELSLQMATGRYIRLDD